MKVTVGSYVCQKMIRYEVRVGIELKRWLANILPEFGGGLVAKFRNKQSYRGTIGTGQ